MNIARLLGAATIFALLMGSVSTADAYGSLRCKGKLIRPGMAQDKVMSLCGEPRHRVVEKIPVRSRTLSGSRLSGITVSERWEYHRGWGRFPAVLTFRDGELRHVDYLEKRAGRR